MDAFEACDVSLVDAFRVTAGWQESASVSEVDGVVVVVGKSRFPMPYSNTAFPATPAVSASDVVRVAEAVFPDRRYVVWCRGTDGGDVGRFEAERGFVSLGDLPAMVIERAPEAAKAPGIDVERVTDAAGFSEFVRVSELAYVEAGLPEQVARTLLARPAVAVRSSTIAVARIDGRAIAAAVSITDARSGVGGVYWVGTVPAARRRGAADLVTRFVTRAAFDEGARVVTLQASRAGEPIYLRMGYREVGRYARFLSPPRA